MEEGGSTCILTLGGLLSPWGGDLLDHRGFTWNIGGGGIFYLGGATFTMGEIYLTIGGLLRTLGEGGGSTCTMTVGGIFDQGETMGIYFDHWDIYFDTMHGAFLLRCMCMYMSGSRGCHSDYRESTLPKIECPPPSLPTDRHRAAQCSQNKPKRQ